MMRVCISKFYGMMKPIFFENSITGVKIPWEGLEAATLVS